MVAASCRVDTTESQESWSTVDSMGVCVITSSSPPTGTTTPTRTMMTTYYYLGATCDGTSALGHYIASADSRTATVTLNFRW
jgi:hypothetical protein